MNEVKWVSLYSRKVKMIGDEAKNDRKKPLEYHEQGELKGVEQ
jgi:hypothetical protein